LRYYIETLVLLRYYIDIIVLFEILHKNSCSVKIFHRNFSSVRILHKIIVLKKGKAIPVTGRGDPQGCETSRLPHFLDNRLTDGGEVFSLTRRPPLTPTKIPGTYFCQRPSRPHGHSAAGRISSIEKSSDLIVNRTRDLPACSILP
jgi:hypothetical protein